MASKRSPLLFGLFLLLLLLGGGLFLLRDRIIPRGEPRQLAWDQIAEGSGYVEVAGTAHYPVRVKQTFQPTWLNRDPPTLHIFPLFAPGDTMSREIHVLVLSQVEPDRMLGLEDRRVRGEVRIPTSRLLTRGVLDTYREHAYQFTDDFLLLIEDPPEVGGDS